MLRIGLAFLWFAGVTAAGGFLGVDQENVVEMLAVGLVTLLPITWLFPGYFYRGEPLNLHGRRRQR